MMNVNEQPARAFERLVGDFVSRHGLLLPTYRLLVTVSGGADSVALLRVLVAMGYDCRAVHCNFHLRDAESDRDEQFVRSLCRELGVPVEVIDFDTRAYAKINKVSIEMAAREQRYAAFEEQRVAMGCDVIAVAHHAEDSVETMLMNLLRGTGLDGLTGIKARNGRVVRPLLSVTRQDITNYLTALGQPWVEDSSNASDDYLRNRIRHHLLPLMEELNATALQNMLATAEHLQGASDVLQGVASEAAGVTVLHGLLSPYGYNATQVENLLSALKNRRQTLLPSGNDDEEKELTFSLQPYDATTMPHTNTTLCLDVRSLTAPLHLRHWREGDRFYPFGMGGRRKLVSDVLTDCKLSRREREAQQVLCVGDDIVWVVGIRSDERYRVPTDATQLLVIEKKTTNNDKKTVTDSE